MVLGFIFHMKECNVFSNNMLNYSNVVTYVFKALLHDFLALCEKMELRSGPLHISSAGDVDLLRMFLHCNF